MGLYIILMGVQGAGKGVQASFISKTFGIPHVSTGDVFRAMKGRDDELGKRVQSIMAAGSLVDDDTTNEVVADRLSQPDARNGVILDGYPRNPAQAAFLDEYLAQREQSVSAVLLLNLDLFVAFKRAFGRVTAESGDSYNLYYKSEGLEIDFEQSADGFPPKVKAVLAETGEVLKRRPDDANAMAVVKRIDTYLETTQPVIDYYREMDLVIDINADQDIEAVSEDIRKAIEVTRAGS
ncbi:adenylate kinase [Anaerolineales bacterium]